MTWLAGITAALLLGVATVIALSAKERLSPAVPLWDIPRVAGSYTTIVGTLSGFTVASAIFIANGARGSPAFHDAIGLYVLAFLSLIGSTMQFATTPNLAGDRPKSYVSDQNISYVLANLSFYVGVAMSWLGLRLLLLAIDFGSFAATLTWVLLFAIVLGAFRVSMHLYRHTLLPPFACFSVPPVAFGLVLMYRLVADMAPMFWPANNQVLAFATTTFFIVGAAYLAQTLLLALNGHTRWEGLVTRYGHRFLIAFAQMSVVMVFFVWLAVAEA